MHFMIGRIFMNQESKVINVHLEKRENKDYLLRLPIPKMGFAP